LGFVEVIERESGGFYVENEFGHLCGEFCSGRGKD
jgi:hypothetical protein